MYHPTFYSELHFYEQFRKDLEMAQKSVVIISPFITEKRTAAFEDLFRIILKKGVNIYVITKPIKEQGCSAEVFNELKKLGLKILERRYTHEKLAIIDNRIIWHGSLNILSHRNTQELMIRLVLRDELIQEILKLCGINMVEIDREIYEKQKLEEINKIGIGTCPRGHKMIVKRGKHGLFMSCSNFPNCKETVPISEEVLINIYGEKYLICDRCGARLKIKYNPKTKNRFLRCPECKLNKNI